MKDEKGNIVSKNLDFHLALAQMRCIPGNLRNNFERMLRMIDFARNQGAKMIVFPELCTSGYMLGDRWEDDSFIQEIEVTNDRIRAASTDTVVIFGSVRADWDRVGED